MNVQDKEEAKEMIKRTTKLYFSAMNEIEAYLLTNVCRPLS